MSLNSSTFAPTSAFVAGYSALSCDATRRMSARAAATLIPGRRRPTMCHHAMLRSCAWALSSTFGTYIAILELAR